MPISHETALIINLGETKVYLYSNKQNRLSVNYDPQNMSHVALILALYYQMSYQDACYHVLALDVDGTIN